MRKDVLLKNSGGEICRVWVWHRFLLRNRDLFFFWPWRWIFLTKSQSHKCLLFKKRRNITPGSMRQSSRFREAVSQRMVIWATLISFSFLKMRRNSRHIYSTSNWQCLSLGAIAALIGKPRNARQVGFALKGLPNEHMSNSSVSRSTNMALQFDPRDGFLDERMFIGSRDDDDSSDEEDSGGDRQATPPRFHTGNVPWWRVIGSGGVVPVRARPEQRDNHARRLLEEGVECDGYRVDMRLYEWVPQANLFANADHGE